MEMNTRDVRVKYHSSSEIIPEGVRNLFSKGMRNGFVNGYYTIPVRDKSGVCMTDLACLDNPSFYRKAADFIEECDGVEAIVSVEVLRRDTRGELQ